VHILEVRERIDVKRDLPGIGLLVGRLRQGDLVVLRLRVAAEEDDAVVRTSVCHSQPEDAGVKVDHLRHVPHEDAKVPESRYFRHFELLSLFRSRSPENRQAVG
jgi:hypothetical protein